MFDATLSNPIYSYAITRGTENLIKQNVSNPINKIPA